LNTVQNGTEPDVVVLTCYVGCGISRLARYNLTHVALEDAAGKVKYDEGLPVPPNLGVVTLPGAAFAPGRIDEALWCGAYALGGGVPRPWALTQARSGAAVAGRTLRVPNSRGRGCRASGLAGCRPAPGRCGQ
jgi:CDP-diacylglycerol--serine O-phosphatidyltransferase